MAVSVIGTGASECVSFRLQFREVQAASCEMLEVMHSSRQACFDGFRLFAFSLLFPRVDKKSSLRIVGQTASNYRLRVTPSRGQASATGQVEQWGETGLQQFWPKVTSRVL